MQAVLLQKHHMENLTMIMLQDIIKCGVCTYVILIFKAASQYILFDFTPNRHKIEQETIHSTVSLVVSVAHDGVSVVMTACKGPDFTHFGTSVRKRRRASKQS